MAKIKPFRAIIYNQAKIKDLASVVCPPYDVISYQKQEYYYDINPCNLIHILLGKDMPNEDKYERAGNYFKDWLKNKILVPDDAPCVYFYSQQYILKGEKKARYGFIALLRLADEKSNVFGHENTRIEPKEDRLMLLRQVKANLSPIFVLFPDRKRIIQRIQQQYTYDKKPFIDIVDDEKIAHKVWRLSSPDILDKLQKEMQGENIFIADGHHRYEVACAFREQAIKKLGGTTGEEGFNYILAYFTNTESRGLTILPIHRLVKSDLSLGMDELKISLKENFDVEEVKDKIRFFFLMDKGGQTEHLLGLYKDKKYWLLRLKNIKILDRIISDKSPKLRSLDVTILNYLILKNIFKLDLDSKENITFSPHAEELIERVDSDSSYMAFFLNPVKVQQIISLALTGEKMPAKSTYFYPKVLSGLVINKHE